MSDSLDNCSVVLGKGLCFYINNTTWAVA